MSASETRQAENGQWYTRQEFQAYYKERGQLMWNGARQAQRDGLNDGASEHVVMPPATFAATSRLHMLMMVDDIPALQRNCSLSRQELHCEARTLLNMLSAGSEQSENLDGVWEHWKEYVAFHKDGVRLVGPGIVCVSGQHIERTTDPNRANALRFDFVLHHLDGGYVRIHPGTKAKTDAQPRYFPSSATEHVQAPSLQWRQLPASGVFREEDAALVPQIDRMGTKRAWQHMIALSLPENRDLSEIFPWWLWLANLSQHKPGIIGAGIVSAQLEHALHQDSVVLSFTREDASVCFVALLCNGRGEIKVTIDS